MRSTLWWAMVAGCMAACGSSSNPQEIVDAPQITSHCGDGICAPDEVTSCPMDCGALGSGSGSGSDIGSGSSECPGSDAVCGNGVCEPPCESVTSCPIDCGAGSGSSTGSGGLDCGLKTVQDDCILCLGLDICDGAGITVAACSACALGS